MKERYRSLGLLAVVLVGALAMSGAAAGSASAGVCLKTANTKEAVFGKRSTTGVCEGTAGTMGGWVLVQEEQGDPIETRSNAVLHTFCFKTEETKESSWADSQCTKEKTGGGFVKVVSACRESRLADGQGSSLQKIAQQEIWVPESNCAATYKSTSSGKAREVFGAEGPPGKPSTSGDTFIGTDEPLNETQLKNLDTAANGEFGTTKGQALVIPVAQAAVAIIVNPPAGCTITKITNANLLAVLNGTKTEWKEIATGATCAGGITRVVRKDKSGTTFVFKTYLEEIAKGVATCSGKTWKELAEPANNLVWPENGQVGCAGLSAVVKAAEEGGGGEAKEVLAKEGSIGYANLGDARAQYNGEVGNHYHWVAVENSSTGAEKVFESPGTGAAEPQKAPAEANCEGTEYKNKPAVGPDDDWSKVNGAHPSGNKHYPICTLTYDVALVNYNVAGYTGEANMEEGLGTEEYLEYVVKPEGGQAALAKHDYREVEEAVGKFAQEEALLVAGVKISASASELKFFAKNEKKTVEYTNSSLLESWLPFGPYISGANGSAYLLVPGSNTCTGTIGIGGVKCKVEIEFVGTKHGKATLLLRQAPSIILS